MTLLLFRSNLTSTEINDSNNEGHAFFRFICQLPGRAHILKLINFYKTTLASLPLNQFEKVIFLKYERRLGFLKKNPVVFSKSISMASLL